MAKKKAVKKPKVTLAKKRRKPLVTDSGIEYDAIKKYSTMYDRSNISYHLERLREQFATGGALQNWEVELIDKMIEEYNAIYKSPLAEAMK